MTKNRTRQVGLNTMEKESPPHQHHHPSNAPSRPCVFRKMEKIMRALQEEGTGVPVRSQKVFLTSIPCAFMGYDLVEWLMERLLLEDSAEAVHLAALLCQYGYFFPASDSKNLMVRDDGTLYRFQAPYFWPSGNHHPDNTDYAIYLVKRSMRNKQKHGLEEYEQDMFNKLKKVLSQKWELICMQAQEQVKLIKERKKADKIVMDSQERAYWRVHRPPPGIPTPLDHCPVPVYRNGIRKKQTIEDIQKEVKFLKDLLSRTRLKKSQAIESLIHHCELYVDYDPFVSGVQPSNPWVTDDNTLWMLENDLVQIPTEKRVHRWSLSLRDLLADKTGLRSFEDYLRTEYSSENIHFWKVVEDLRTGSRASLEKRVHEIYEEYLAPGASCQVNLDSKTVELTQQAMKNPNRYTFDAAQSHVFTLMNKDSYPRFLRSEAYKHLLANAIHPSHKKKSIFSFGGGVKKKNSTPNAHNCSTTGNKRRGSNSSDQRNLSGSSSDLQDSLHEGRSGSPVGGPFMGHHSLSTSNLHDLECEDNTCRDLANSGKKRSTWSNLLSSPTSQEKLNDSQKEMLNVPKKKSYPSHSTEVGLLETSLSLGLSLAVPVSKKSSVLKGRRSSDDPATRKRNEVCSWKEEERESSSAERSRTPSPITEQKRSPNEVCPWEDA